jgi:hypothetical protein
MSVSRHHHREELQMIVLACPLTEREHRKQDAMLPRRRMQECVMVRRPGFSAAGRKEDAATRSDQTFAVCATPEDPLN